MSIRKCFLVAAGFVIAIGVASCVYVKKDVVQATCTIPDVVTYSGNVQPIIQANCYACHSSSSNLTGILLDNYNSIKSYAQTGTLYGVINHSAGYRAMPDGGAKLSDCTIATIKKWIDNGSLNN